MRPSPCISAIIRPVSNPKLDELIDAADVASGEERVKLYQEANAYSASEIVPDVMMFHMINYVRISPRLDYRPDALTNTMMELSTIGFK